MKGRHIIIPAELKQQVLDQLHLNHMGIEKTKLLICESVYWVDINTDIEMHLKTCSTCLEFQQMQPKEKIVHHDIPLRSWEVLGVDICHFNNKNYLCIIDYHSKFPVIKRMKGLSTESNCNNKGDICRIQNRLMSDAGTNFISERFRRFCSRLNIDQTLLSAYHHQSNGWVEACIKFIKCTLKKCANSSGDIHMALLQIHTTPLGQGLPSPATLLFNCLVHSVMPVVDRKPVCVDNDDKDNTKLVNRQHKNDTNNDASQVFASIPIG